MDGERAVAVGISLILLFLIAQTVTGQGPRPVPDRLRQASDATSLEPFRSFDSSRPVNYTLQPNRSGWVTASGIPPYHVRIGPDGFRDSIPEREDETLLLAVGDSITFGVGVHGNASYPQVVDQRLENLSVLNVAKPGAGFPDYRQLLSSWDGSRPDLVVVGVVGNDHMSAQESGRIAMRARNQTASPREIQRLMREIRRKRYTLAERSRIMVDGGSWIARWASEQEIPAVFYMVQVRPRVSQAFERRFEYVVRPPLRYRTDWEGAGRPNRYRVSWWDAHPNAAGHRLLAARLERYLREQGLVAR